MKKLQHIILGVALLLAGCEDPLEADKALIDSFDHTLPAYVMMSHSMKTVAAASSTLIHACNLNEWLSAENDEARLAVEDKYYPYLKVREVEDNLWNIYSADYRESYYLSSGLTLNEEGARWRIHALPTIYNPQPDDLASPVITRLAEDTFEVTLTNTNIWFSSNPQFGLYKYLFEGNCYNYNRVTATFRIESNNGAYRKGEAEDLVFSISGEGSVWGNSQYSLRLEIDEPIVIHFDTNSKMVEGTVGVGVMNITNTVNSERTTVTMSPYNAIVIDYEPQSGGTMRGYYDWSGENISPR